jgi:PKD repeat protein
MPSGAAQGKIRIDYTFTTSATDTDGDDLYYKWSWGDGTFSDWMGPFSSSEEIEVSHNWTKRGSYEVMVKVRDEHRRESSWSDSFTITLSGFPFLQWLLELIQELFSLFFS